MPKYYSVPSLYQRNIFLEKRIKSLKDLNAALKIQIAELLKSKNDNQEQMLPQTEQHSEVYLYFSYKQQIKQKLQEIKDLQEKCSKIFYHSTLRSIDQKAGDANDEDAQLNGNQADIGERDIMRQRRPRTVEQDIDEHEQGTNGRKMSKTQSLQRKKQQKRAQQQNRNNTTMVQNQQRIMMNGYNLPQIVESNNPRNQNSNLDSAIQKVPSQNLLPPIKFLMEFLTEDEVPQCYNSIVSDYQSERNSSGVKKHLNLSNKRFYMDRFVKYDWRNIEKMELNNCKLTTQDWDLFCDHYYLFKNLRQLSLTQNLIKVVQGEQIEKFPSLLILNFGISSSGKPNPLTLQTIQKLQQWEKQRKNPNLLFLYRQPKNNTAYRYSKPIQRPVQRLTKVLKQTQCLEYLKNVFRSYNPLGSQYGPISKATKDSQSEKKGVKYSENSFYLIHNFARPVMQDFIKQNWYEFEQMRFCNCRITDEDWQVFTSNAQQYPHLKYLLLNGNFIKEVRYEDLEKLKELKYLEIEGNNLSERSICDIEQFKQKHKDVKILY